MTSGYDSDFHDGDHLRRLLGQRAARADIHDRFSSSEFSDSPSIYSHAYFSPRPSDRTDANPHTSTYHHATHVRQPSEPRSLMTDRQRLGIPDASSLDLDDDPRSSYLSTMSHEEEPGDDYDDSSTEEADGDDTEVHRVSAYGPKMTVHSRAPWEVEDGGSPEPEDQDGVGKRNLLGFGKRDTAKKPWGRDTRSPVDSRPSFDSVQSRGKQSFETASSHVSAGGALLALAQASMSSTSLGLSPSPQTSLREKLSLPRFRSRTPSNAGRQELVDSRVYSRTAASHKAHSPAYGARVSSPTGSEFTRSDSRPSLSEPASPHTPVYQHEYHPYANPDLVGSVATHPPSRRLEELHALTYSTPQSPVVARSESAATITESSTVTTMSTLSQTRSQSSVLTPGTSVSSLQPTPEIMAGNRSLSKTRKTPGPIDVASINVIHSRTSEAEPGVQEVTVFSQPDFPSPSVMAPSWPTSPNPVPMKLISLEEAQAQVRERSRSATATASDTGSAPSQSVRAPDTGFNQTATSWSRLRSASSNGSAKAKNLTSSSVVDLSTTPTLPSSSSLAGSNGLPSKTIARKKSGFMRLFNSKEKMPSSPPPVPSISTDIISSAAPPLPTPSTPSSMARARKQSAHRVPVPSITPSLLGDSEGSGSSFESRSETVDGAIASGSNSHATRPGSRERQLSSRRNVPGLSIVTNASTSSRSSPSTTKESPVPVLATPKTTLGDNATTAMLSPEFMTLSLRRISTTFGPEFTGRSSDGDHEFHRPSLVTDTGTPTTGASLISPRSPPLLYNLEQPMVDVKSVPVEDQSSVIRTLQEQIVAARKAWQHQLWELEGQVRDLKAELEELRVADDGQNYCATCGRGSAAASGTGPRVEDLRKAGVKVGGVVNRPRARTGVGSRFASGT